MTTPDANDFNLYLARECFDSGMCAEIIADLAQAPDEKAPIYGISGEAGSVDERVRKVARLIPSEMTVNRVKEKLLAIRDQVSAHFEINLTGSEDPQFLRYREGDFFVAHQDGNTGMLRTEREQWRKVSIIVFLNQQSTPSMTAAYGGGSLVFSEWRPGRRRGHYELPGEAGLLVAFPSETTHEIKP